ncbi:MAG: tripartite tricarboxylate transporter TctB family protein, partial [Rhodobacteraceae bacterium]|nr:tripartite tricarboxylate transporter TctB family protein [Paracoccaceae bacterium]
MGKHRTTDVIEAVIWLVIAIVFFAVSFEFNQ